MPGTVKIPVVGTVSKRNAGIAGGLLAATVVIYEIRKRKTAAAAASSSSSAATGSTPNASGYQVGTDPAGNTGVIDPTTGFVLGTGQDQQALTSLGQSGSIFASGTPQPGAGFASNAAWSQAALQYLTQAEPNADAGTIGAALGAYIGGQPLTPDQVSIVEQAIAFENLPPQSGPAGHPPAYTTVTATPSTPGASSAGANIVAGLPGTRVAQGVAVLQQNGIILNTVTNSRGEHVSAQANAAAVITGGVYYATGQAGDHFANSATLFIQ